MVTLTEIAAENLRGKEYAGIIGQSPVMRQIFARIRQLSESDATVLVTGESGTGKELVARALHSTGQRRPGPFVTVNCASLPASMLESELFGHVRGAFTGAIRDRAGRVSRAAGGTLFLDEVGELPLELQPKLLRLLQDHRYEPVGSDHTLHADIRVVAATNVDLARAMTEGRFREDLYYRLRVIPIHLPPLRERHGDIPLLAGTLLRRRREVARRTRLTLSVETLRMLEAHHWPGNVRELVNTIDYLVALAPGPVAEPGDLPPELLKSRGQAALPQASTSSTDRGQVHSHRRYQTHPGPEEERAIRQALDANDWHRERSAAALGMDRVTLYRRMKHYGIQAQG